MEPTLLVNTGGVVGEAVLLRAQTVTLLHCGHLAPRRGQRLQCRVQLDAVAGAVVAHILVRELSTNLREVFTAPGEGHTSATQCLLTLFKCILAS